jgi:hypothetical protein
MRAVSAGDKREALTGLKDVCGRECLRQADLAHPLGARRWLFPPHCAT